MLSVEQGSRQTDLMPFEIGFNSLMFSFANLTSQIAFG